MHNISYVGIIRIRFMGPRLDHLISACPTSTPYSVMPILYTMLPEKSSPFFIFFHISPYRSKLSFLMDCIVNAVRYLFSISAFAMLSTKR